MGEKDAVEKEYVDIKILQFRYIYHSQIRQTLVIHHEKKRSDFVVGKRCGQTCGMEWIVRMYKNERKKIIQKQK